MSLIVVDASVAVRWLVELPHSGAARALLTPRHRLVAPTFLPAEVGSALLKMVRAKVLSRTEGEDAFEDFFRAPVRLLPIQHAAAEAMKAALQSGLSFYDCLYLTLAEVEQGFFATADVRFWNAMKATPHARHIQLIGG